MSALPQAPQDVSLHPKKGSVVAPVDRDMKEREVDRNIRIYTVLSALRQGKLPTNAQLNKSLTHLLNNTLSPSGSHLSPEGKKLLNDSRSIIETLRLLIDEKNADELVQDFIFGMKEVEPDTLKESLMGITEDLPDLPQKEDGDDPVKHLRTLLKLLLSNAEVRKLVTDFSTIGRDLLSRTASAAAGAIAPHPEALAEVDKPAEEGKFFDDQGHIPGTGVRIRQDSGDELGEGVKFVSGDGDETKKVGEMKAQSKDVAASGIQAAGDAVFSGDEKKKRGVMDKVKDTVNGMKPNSNDIPQELKETANDSIERGKRFLSEEYFPKERREQFVWRGKKVILELQNHDDYQASIRWLIRYVEQYVQHARNMASDQRGPVIERLGKGAKKSNLDTSLLQLRTILERLANNTSMDIIFNAVNALVDDARRDDALWTWWESVGLWIKKVLLQPGYVISPECTNHATRLRDLGKEFYEGKYGDHFDGLFDSVGRWIGGVGEDPVNKQFAGDWARLTKDLLFDSEGSLKFKPELWDDIRRVVLPGIIDTVGYIPIPRIEYTDEALDLVIENLTLQGRNLFPNVISFDINNYIRFSPYGSISAPSSSRGKSHPNKSNANVNAEHVYDEMTNRHRVKIHLEQMQADMRDVAFYYRKKKGLPKMKDSGVADVVVGGKGLNVLIDLVSAPPSDPTSVFHIHSINVKLDSHSLKFSIRDSNHDFLYKTLRPLATGLIKKQVEKAVTEGVRVGLTYLDGQLVGVRQRMMEGKEQVAQHGDHELRDIFQRGKNAAAQNARDDATSPSAALGAGVGEATNAAQQHAGNLGNVATRASRVSTTSGPSVTSSSSSGRGTSPSKMKTGTKSKGSRNSTFRIVGDKRNSLFADKPSLSGDSAGMGTVTGKIEQGMGMVGKPERTAGWRSDAFRLVN